MTNKVHISSSIVLFNENLQELTKTINCFLKVPLSKKLYLIDNTPNQRFKNKFENDCIEYISVGKNIGFGNGHNLVLDKIKNLSVYHLILNPDVTFNADVIPNLIKQLERDKTIAMIAPKVLFPDGSHQYSCRKYPIPFSLLLRRVSILKIVFKTKFFEDEYRNKDLSKPFFPEYITGCFQLYNTKDFVEIKGFDERYFLYMEDVDICKKIDAIEKKKLYYPQEKIYHILKQGSLKNIKLFFRHLSSAIKYFKKWGFS